MVRHGRGKLGSRDLCVRGQGGSSGGAGPAVSRRGREPAVHHGEGLSAQRGVPRSLSRACHRQYSLAVPFTERFFDLALASENGRCGYVGMITANSFMKREFGKKLIEEFFPRIDLTHVVDTSGAYIPGHGTPTVILFGRNRKPERRCRAGGAWHQGGAQHAGGCVPRARVAVDRPPDRPGGGPG